MKLGINCGSGQRKFTATPEVNWANVDSVSREGHEPDILCDGAHLTMYQDGEVDYFVLHHVLEHFGCGEAGGLIKEAWRVLKPGGSLLVFVPNMRALAERWLEGRLSTQIYLTNVYGAYMGDEESRHKWGFDPDHLFEFLSVKGAWTTIRLFDWRDIPGSDCARDFWITGMECIK